MEEEEEEVSPLVGSRGSASVAEDVALAEDGEDGDVALAWTCLLLFLPLLLLLEAGGLKSKAQLMMMRTSGTKRLKKWYGQGGT